MQLENGVHPHVPREVYDRLQRVNWSTLKHLGRSATHYRHRLLNPEKDTGPRQFGRLVHMAVLEPERYSVATAVWDAGDRRGKKWKAFQEKYEGLEIITATQAKLCQDLQAAVRSDAVASKYVSAGKPEATVLWTHPVDYRSADKRPLSLDCKARPDFIADVGALVDLKTTRDASPEGFGKEVWRYRYHTQAAMYVDGYAAVTGKRLPYVLVAVENEAPHVVQVYRVPERVLELGREEYQGLAEHLAYCRAESKWAGYAEEELELELPRWAASFADEESVEGLDLVIRGEG